MTEAKHDANEEVKVGEIIDDRMREEEAESLCRWAAARAGVIVVAPLLGTMSLVANEIYLIIKLGKVYGEEISEHNGRMLYTRILQIYCYDVLPEGAEPGEIVYSFKINFTDGTAATLEFAKVGERTFAVIRNGQELGIYSRISDFQSIIDGIADIKIGYSLERVF